MNRTELISDMSERSGLTKKDTEKALAAFMESVIDAVSKDEKVQLLGFGTFELRHRNERKGLNPRTKEPVTIPASKAPAFKVSKSFKEIVNK